MTRHIIPHPGSDEPFQGPFISLITEDESKGRNLGVDARERSMPLGHENGYDIIAEINTTDEEQPEAALLAQPDGKIFLMDRDLNTFDIAERQGPNRGAFLALKHAGVRVLQRRGPWTFHVVREFNDPKTGKVLEKGDIKIKSQNSPISESYFDPANFDWTQKSGRED